MNDSGKNVLIYVIIAAVVLVSVFLYTRNVFSPAYSISLQLSQSPQSPTYGSNTLYPYQTSIFRLNINNTGSSPISNMTVVVYLNSQALQTLSIRSLPAHQGTTKNLSYTYPTSGNYSFQVVADPAHVFNIQNRQASQDSIAVSVSPAQIPDVFTSIPNNNIVDAQSFALSSLGASEALYMFNNYTLGFSSGIFNGNTFPLIEMLKPSAPYLQSFLGDRAVYKNGTVAYAAWMQSGVVTMAGIKSFYSSLSYNTVNATIGNANGLYMKWNATTSLCFAYSGGWIKIISYSNQSGAGTCSSIGSVTYADTESNTLLQQAASDKKMYDYQNVSSVYNANMPTMIYSGAHDLGRSVISDNGAVSIINFFSVPSNSMQNGGLFAGLISRNVPPASMAQRTCYDGLVFSDNAISVCSQYTPQTTGWLGPNLLLNSTYISNNHTVSLYSLVNDSQAASAHLTASILIFSLGINETHLKWKSLFSNSCRFGSPQLGCGFVGMNASVPSITMNVINNYASPITVTKVNCFYAAPPTNFTMNWIVPAGATQQITTPCRVVPPTGFVAGMSFNTTIYYTLNGKNQTANGTFNFTTFG